MVRLSADTFYVRHDIIETFAITQPPTQILSPETVLHRVDADVQSALSRQATYQDLAMVNYAKLVIPTEEEMRLALAEAHATAADRVAQITEARRPYALRAPAWPMKLRVLRN